MAVIDELVTRVQYLLREIGSTDPKSPVAELKIWLANGQDEICRRAYAIEDNSTVAVCKVIMATGIAEYAINSKILLIEDAALYTAAGVFDSHIDVVDKHELTYQSPTWVTDDGKPAHIIVTSHNTIKVTPIPTITYVGYYLMLNVKRLPLNRLSDVNPVPEISSIFSQDMVHWACHMAYLKDDVDTQDLKQSDRFYALFEGSVGPRPTADVERALKTQPHGLRLQVSR